jgi:hypothetical protein
MARAQPAIGLFEVTTIRIKTVDNLQRPVWTTPLIKTTHFRML